ncbi:MAG TPA: lmo0937 family membrane protein [Polyangia bacterium]|jgi:hypothetical protein|nr:lmo0937 family membrane protein [Polyangia bacterium]
MLWLLSALLLAAWLAGMVASMGPLVHVFLVLAIFAVMVSLIRRDTLDTI